MASQGTATGTFTGTGASVTINLGFVPQWARVFTPTYTAMREKFSNGMASNACIEIDTRGGGWVLETSSNVTFSGSTMVLSAAVCVNGDTISWTATG